MNYPIWILVQLMVIVLASCSSNNTDGNSDENAQSTEIMTTADANVLSVKAIQNDDGSWTFQVTVFHPDTGWDDYTNGWDVVLEDGTVLKPDPESPFTRLLLHPHVNEQPFTRGQINIVIPDDIQLVIVRAHDIVDGFGGIEIVVDLTVSTGKNFEVQAQP